MRWQHDRLMADHAPLAPSENGNAGEFGISLFTAECMQIRSQRRWTPSQSGPAGFPMLTGVCT